ncbi:MAG: hypothetical protein OXB88_11115, partial [Bacteriovoracales bacterium]|nr:hypothetical protein [Bacteriovoracales bacterium]
MKKILISLGIIGLFLIGLLVFDEAMLPKSVKVARDQMIESGMNQCGEDANCFKVFLKNNFNTKCTEFKLSEEDCGLLKDLVEE